MGEYSNPPDVTAAQKTLDDHAVSVLSEKAFTPEQARLLVDYFVQRPGAGQPPTPPGGPPYNE